jgi:predicted dehydrogenase
MDGRAKNVGVIGFGKMGLLHAGIVNGLAGSRLAAVADPADVLADMVQANKPGLAIYKDYQRMLAEESLDAVFISTPTFLHVPACQACVDRGLPFFVEKPLSNSAAEARPLLEALRKRPVTNMVGYVYRYMDTFAKARQVLAARPLGKLIHLRATMYVSQVFRRGKGWRYDPKTSGGGVLITQNSHLIDLLVWLFGPVESVSGQTKSWYSRHVEDYAHAWLTFANGLTGFVDCSWSARHYRLIDLTIDVQGEAGTATVSEDEVKVFLDEPAAGLPGGWTTWRKPNLYRGVEIDVGGPAYTRQDADFLHAAGAAGSVGSDVASALHVQEVLDAIYRSAAGGRQVQVGET